MKFTASLILLAGLNTMCLGQAKQTPGNKAVVAQPLSAADSGMVKQLFFSALREKTLDNKKAAAELFNRVLQIDANNDASLYELANIEQVQNNLVEARLYLERAVALNRDNEWYWNALASLYEKSNDLPKLNAVFDELIRLNPDKSDYYYDKANAFYLQKRYTEALKLYDKVEELAGPSEELLLSRQKVYLRQNDVKKAASLLDALIEQNPTQTRYYLAKAEIFSTNKQYDSAIAILRKAIAIDPSNGLLHLALADIFREQNKPAASYDELEAAFADSNLDIDQKLRILLGYLPRLKEPDARASALQLSKVLVQAHPDNSKAYALYGDLLLQSNQVKEAKEAYKKSISLDKQAYGVQEQLVRIEFSENNMDAVIYDGEKALELFPNQAWMNYMVGVAWLEKKNYVKSISYLKNTVMLAADDKNLLTQSYSGLGDAYHATGDRKSSDEAYEKALEADPDNAYTLNNYAYYLSLRNEQLEKAAQMSKHSNNLAPDNASFEDTYAWILFKQKKYAEAKLWAEKSLQHDKNASATKTEHYGDILYFLGDVAGAVKNWQKAKALGASSPVLERKINEKKYSE
ncbi:tetratricopeptide repeat protein [Mucilaginibacter sp. 44-25]|uniref:tetratricopeptide repeat protein n=1 Tax=Mucilaginibacter sp. 44-25 TaxID=1895794 RepID=UPI00095ECFCF|nr:tetratricopeptide repeat protein [Mucilaginibacter sp. 44-25]OJW17627.1 MAG: hypothetical protein BGO48_08835 [Mucilaginibacter sp. 44-25]